ncbi:hypothetical protein [Actinoplanes palleronii]|uniref:Knr4/Smi1-like domain-containing protein n=1 Tax=Actinoplanes palleronii TaxID=113570 RepID=A0ABQ4BJ15_9ACTN|nr:hypothetical protein [Actinoplanes palleronii]GIE70669.1 hypothetical protein Apa02nite_067770 [Actinoplanes palleronii]
MPDAGKSPVYSASEIGAVVLEFLTFLTTLHRDSAGLEMPPPGGWPSYTPENCAGFKSELVIEVLRNLPYLRSFDSHEDSLGQIHYKSCLLDYTTFDSEILTESEYLWEYVSDGGDESVPDHVFIFSEGRESGGRTLFLDVLHGKVIEVEIRGGNEPIIQDIKEYFEELKRKYRNLEIIPIPHMDMVELEAVGMRPGEPDEEVSKEEIMMQSDPDWESDLDIQYTQQLYRAFGWPDNFRRVEAFSELRELIEARYAASE